MSMVSARRSVIPDRIKAFLADKGYDADFIREELSEAVIPHENNRRDPVSHDRISIVGEISSSASSINSRTGNVLSTDMTKPRNHILPSSILSHHSNE
ncbi:hypothetical protein [Gluconobacter sp.]|uniref:hypothetical protein n=1 Tax=Gluconobacter sp. TaxID=1876758 RepID=UPI0039EB17BA